MSRWLPWSGIVVLLVVSWWLWPAAPAVPMVSPVVESEAPVETQRGDSPTDGAPEHVARVAVTAAAAAAIDPADAARMVQVRVLGSDGVPLVGVEVRYLSVVRGFSGPMDQATFEKLERDPISELERIGERAVTGADGIARWPWRPPDLGLNRLFPADEWWVTARQRAACGHLRIPVSTRPRVVHDLRLRSDQALVARVQGMDGRPAPDVRVSLSGWRIARHSADAELTEFTHRISDADGMVRFAHVQCWTGDLVRRGDRRPLRLSGDGLLRDVAVEVDADALPAMPPVLQLPAVGEIELVLRDDMGVAPPAGLHAALCMVDNHEILSLELLPASGRARFRTVPAGNRWWAWAPAVTDLRMEFNGPQRDGEVLTVEVPTMTLRTVVGRLLRNGAPAANTTFKTEGLGGVDGVPHWTDGAGRFQLWGTRLAELPDTIESFSIVVDGARDRGAMRAGWRGSLAVQATACDVGDLQLLPETERSESVVELPLLCAGVVRTNATNLSDLRFEISSGSGARLEDLKVDCATGAFECRGEGGNGELRVRHAYRDRVAGKRSFVRGQTDLVVDIRDGATLTADVVNLRPELESCLFFRLGREVTNTADGRPGRLSPDLRTQLPGADSYQWLDLEAGRYRLKVFCFGMREPVMVVPDLIVPTSGACEDQRLRSLELPSISIARVTVRGPTTHLQGPRAAITFDDGGQEDLARDDQGRFLCPTGTGGGVGLVVRASNCRTRHLARPSADTVVELQAGIPVRLRLDVGQRQFRDVDISLSHDGDEMVEERLYREDAAIEWLLPAPGIYSVYCVGDLEPLDTEPMEITVTEAGGTFDIVIKDR